MASQSQENPTQTPTGRQVIGLISWLSLILCLVTIFAPQRGIGVPILAGIVCLAMSVLNIVVNRHSPGCLLMVPLCFSIVFLGLFVVSFFLASLLIL
jgi:hypothetical protein